MNDFMKDRYGADQLTTALGVLGIVVTLIGTVAHAGWLQLVGLALVMVALLRALSKNAPARRRENETWLGLVGKATDKLGVKLPGANGTPTAEDLKRQARTAKKMWKDRKVKAYLKCPTCNTTLAVPRGKGKMIVTCPKCRTRMETRS